MVRRILLGLAALVGVAVLGGGGYAWMLIQAFDASMAKVYDVPPPAITASSDPAVIARGKHLAEGLAGCAISDCHGADLGGGNVVDAGPVGSLSAPNISLIARAYTDGELARLIRRGIKKDGRGARFMPAQDVSWLPDDDVRAVVSYVKQVPVVQRDNKPMFIGALGKILDRRGAFVADPARRIAEHPLGKQPPAPAPTVEYGFFVARLCTGCHGEDHFAGGPIPGTPPSFPPPLNLTPHETGLKGWTFDDFNKLIDTGIRKNGQPLKAFMPVAALRGMDEVERRALWAYLASLPPVAYGAR